MEVVTTGENEAKKNYVTEGVLLAVIPGYVYLVTFCYELGYCHYFNIPAYLISPSLTSILVAALAIFGVFVSSFKLLGLTAPLFRMLSDERKKAYHFLILLNTLFLGAFVLLFTIYGFSKAFFLWFVIAWFLSNVLFVAVPLLLSLSFSRAKTWNDRFEASNEIVAYDPFSFVPFVKDKISVRQFGSFFVLASIAGLAYAVGNGEAVNQRTFLTPSTDGGSGELVVLKVYGDIIVCAPLDRSVGQVSRQLVLLNMSDFDSIWLTEEKVGPLALKRPGNTDESK